MLELSKRGSRRLRKFCSVQCNGVALTCVRDHGTAWSCCRVHRYHQARESERAGLPAACCDLEINLTPCRTVQVNGAWANIVNMGVKRRKKHCTDMLGHHSSYSCQSWLKRLPASQRADASAAHAAVVRMRRPPDVSMLTSCFISAYLKLHKTRS